MRRMHTASTDIGKGDLVVALRDGARSPSGFPVCTPKKGMFYIVTSVYREWYGFGCTLQGLNAKPYKGFFLISRGTHYFEKVVPINEQQELFCSVSDSQEFTQPMPSTPSRVPEIAHTLQPALESEHL